MVINSQLCDSPEAYLYGSLNGKTLKGRETLNSKVNPYDWEEARVQTSQPSRRELFRRESSTIVLSELLRYSLGLTEGYVCVCMCV